MAENQDINEQSTPAMSHEYRNNSNISPEPPRKQRKKDARDRIRVTRACDRCKRKKTRCSGKQPCSLCSSLRQSCEFTAAYCRGRLPSILPETNEGSQVVNDFSNTQLAPTVTSPSTENLELSCPPELLYETNEQQQSNSQHQHATGMSLQLPVPIRVDSRAQSSRNSPEPAQTDLQGHYVGPSSGVSFLLRVQKRLHQTFSLSKNTSVFTFGDAPLPKFNPEFFLLPQKVDAQKMVARYFDFAVATHRFLHRPTIEAWLDEFYENLGLMEQKDGSGERTALLFMVFAQAKEYTPNFKGPNSLDTSARYFQAADHQLSSETGEIRLTNIQARLCQCFYLLSQARVNHCWSLFGTTARLMLALGIHRKRRAETSNTCDLIDLECRKRVFWCAYGLDNYLSGALGRPRIFHDEDIDQELPTCIDDSDLTSKSIHPRNSKAQSIMMASVAHNTLSKIISRILRDLYSIHPPSFPVRFTLSAKYHDDLLLWRKDLSHFLDAGSIHTSLLIPLFQRQRNVLNLAYYHALILVYRPFLLSNFASLNSGNSRSRGVTGTAEMAKNVGHCLEAAMHITKIVNELTEEQQIFRGFWFTHYFAFCAVVVLYVYTIQERRSPKEKYKAYFDAAVKCQEQLSSLAENSLVQRYSIVLEELRLEAVKQTQPQPQAQLDLDTQNQTLEPTSMVNGNSSALQEAVPHTNYDLTNSHNQVGLGSMVDGELSNSDGAIFGEYQSGETPTSLMADLTGWGEFESLVNVGTGGLEFSFVGNQNLW